ncbi:MAG: hypothetical protein HAW63_04390 [Bdellovibrionaceae bacterium]|nr:hypothetical protein [Pseudobdellovibrionaceae bacterium]
MPEVSLSIKSESSQSKTFFWIEEKLSTVKDIEKNIGIFTTHCEPKKHSITLKGEKITVQVQVKKTEKTSLVCVKVNLPLKLALLKTVIKTKLETQISKLLKKIK